MREPAAAPAAPAPAREPMPREELLRCLYLTLRLEDEHEASMPTDGSEYLSHRYFRPSSLREALGHWEHTLGLMRRKQAPRELGLFLHWPFCISQCTFCFCNLKVPDRAGEAAEYRALLVREMDAFRAAFRGTPLTSVYVGGGTPSAMTEAEIDALFGAIEERFETVAEPELYFEASPATLTEGKVRRLLAHGVNHVTLGIQSMDAEVLRRVDRKGQTRAGTERACRMLAEGGRILVGVDLMLGLEGQTEVSFLRDFTRTVSGLRPQNLRVYVFDPRPQTLYAQAGKRLESTAWTRRLRLLERLDELAEAAGYLPTPLDPRDPRCLNAITRQCREARLTGASVLAVGSGGISHAFGSAWYEHPAAWKAPAGPDGLLPFHAFSGGVEEEARGFAVRQLCSWGSLSVPGFRAVFGRGPLEFPGLARALGDLARWGKLAEAPDALTFASPDKLEWLVYAKHLYAPELVEAILDGRRADFDAFRAGRGLPAKDWRAWLERKRVPALSRMYYHRSLPRPRGTL